MVKRKPIPRLINERNNTNVAESTNIYVEKILDDAKRVDMGLKQRFAHIIGDVTKLDIDSIVNAGKPVAGTDAPSVSKIKLYLLNVPVSKTAENSYSIQHYATYKVLKVLEVEAGTTFGELKEIIRENGYSTNNMGVFNVDQEMSNGRHSFVYQDNMSNTIVGVQAAFPLKAGIKAGDTIDTRDYVVDSGYDIWSGSAYSTEKGGYYQSDSNYQECGYHFEDQIVVEEGIAFIVH